MGWILLLSFIAFNVMFHTTAYVLQKTPDREHKIMLSVVIGAMAVYTCAQAAYIDMKLAERHPLPELPARPPMTTHPKLVAGL